jgi:hypothetical protein
VDLFVSEQGPVSATSEHTNELPRSVKDREFIDQDSNSWLFTKHPVPLR